MIRVTIEDLSENPNETVQFETPVFIYSALEAKELGVVPGSVRQGMMRDPKQLENFNMVHLVAVLSGALNQAYEATTTTEAAEEAIQWAKNLSKLTEATGIAILNAKP